MEPVFNSVTSEGVSLINADDWQAAGYDGSGVKVGIVDGGFSGYTTRQSEGDLPESIHTHWSPTIGNEGTSYHGTGCAEVQGGQAEQKHRDSENSFAQGHHSPFPMSRTPPDGMDDTTMYYRAATWTAA